MLTTVCQCRWIGLLKRKGKETAEDGQEEETVRGEIGEQSEGKRGETEDDELRRKRSGYERNRRGDTVYIFIYHFCLMKTTYVRFSGG